jgi:hypothetical protein
MAERKRHKGKSRLPAVSSPWEGDVGARERLIKYFSQQRGFLFRAIGDAVLTVFLAEPPERAPSEKPRKKTKREKPKERTRRSTAVREETELPAPRARNREAAPAPSLRDLKSAPAPVLWDWEAESPSPPRRAVPMEKPTIGLQPLWPGEADGVVTPEERVRLAPYWFRWLRVRAGLASREVSRFHRRTPARRLLILYFCPLVAGVAIASLALYLRGAPEITRPVPITAEEETSRLISATDALLKRRETAAAWKNIERLRTLTPDNPRVENLAGVALSLKKDYPAAREIFARLLERDPSNLAAMNNLAEIEFTLKHYDEAARLYRRTLPGTPQKGVTGYRLYTCLLILDRHQEADFVFAKFPVPPSGRSPAWFYAQATRAFLDGKDAEARDFITRAHEYAPSGCSLYDGVLRQLGYLK